MPISVGRLPLNELCDTSAVDKEEIPNTCEGMAPVMLLFERFRNCKRRQLPIVEGIFPSNILDDNSR